jgi:gliding motility-associated-like protein
LLFSTALFSQSYNLLQDSIGFCEGESAVLDVRYQFNNNASINWTTPYNIIANSRTISASRPGKYYVKITSPQFTTPLIDSTFVRVYSKPKPYLRDTTICKGKTVVLDAKNLGMRYAWSTYETSQKIKIESSGTYWVKITNGSCVLYDTLNVRLLQGAGSLISGDMMFCLNEGNKLLSIKVNPGTRILWNTGATSPTINVVKEGTYWVKTQTNNCGQQVDTVKVKLKVCECEMMIPNSFTPNEDNHNDYFFPVLQCDYSYYILTITDRWGNTVFSTNSINTRWDGRFKGNLCPEDIYVYKIESIEKGTDKKLIRNGHISLFR